MVGKCTHVDVSPIRVAVLCFAVLCPVGKLGGHWGAARSPGPWRGSTRSVGTPIWLRFSSCLTVLVVCLAVCFSVLQCPGLPCTCSQPYLTNSPSSPPTTLVPLSRLWRGLLITYKHSPD